MMRIKPSWVCVHSIQSGNFPKKGTLRLGIGPIRGYPAFNGDEKRIYENSGKIFFWGEKPIAYSVDI